MMKAARVLLSLIAALSLSGTAFAQKSRIDEVGFSPGRAYHTEDIDSVNMFNGNLTVAIPLGPSYQVGSSLSYQFHLTYNSASYEYDTYPCQSNPDGCSVEYPNRSSNAGIGWRVSLGQLFPPSDSSYGTLARPRTYIYESPSGGQYKFVYTGNDDKPVLFGVAEDDPAAKVSLRMTRLNPNTREIEFPNGEVHTFTHETDRVGESFNPVWRLAQIRDRKVAAVNYVNITYEPETGRENLWRIRDSVGREHGINFAYWSAMKSGWTQGQQITSMQLAGFGTPFRFDLRSAQTMPASASCPDPKDIPVLKSVTQPDGSQYTINDTDRCHFNISGYTLPTGATVTFGYQAYLVGGPNLCHYGNSAWPGVSSRTVNDGGTVKVWRYIRTRGPEVLLDWSTNLISDPCGVGDETFHPSGPSYWARTSVIAPPDAAGRYTRTDYYFDMYPNEIPARPFNLLPGVDYSGNGFSYGRPGTSGMPPPEAAKGPLTGLDPYNQPPDIAALDGPRRLTSQTYAGCTADGDCTNGQLVRSLYEAFGLPLPSSQKTILHDETSCGSAACYMLLTREEYDGLQQYRSVKEESNLPGAKTITNFTNYPVWSPADRADTSRWYTSNLFTEKWTEMDGVKARQLFWFDDQSGFLKRHRALAGANPGPTDVVTVYSDTNAKGFPTEVLTYGGEAAGQALDTAQPLATMPLPGKPNFKVVNTYTPGIPFIDTPASEAPLVAVGISPFVATSKYIDPDTGAAIGFLHVDRTIDPILGVVTSVRDTAGVQTSYGYNAATGRLDTITTPGSVTSLTYVNATGVGAGARPSVASRTASGSTTLGEQRYYYDKSGRLLQTRQRMPNASTAEAWSVVETGYDDLGREVRRTSATSA
ncbi:MAG TPA: hypothetical protein VF698_02425, partial [Thermoanaerobaculia bacterium]